MNTPAREQLSTCADVLGLEAAGLAWRHASSGTSLPLGYDMSFSAMGFRCGTPAGYSACLRSVPLRLIPNQPPGREPSAPLLKVTRRPSQRRMVSRLRAPVSVPSPDAMQARRIQPLGTACGHVRPRAPITRVFRMRRSAQGLHRRTASRKTPEFKPSHDEAGSARTAPITAEASISRASAISRNSTTSTRRPPPSMAATTDWYRPNRAASSLCVRPDRSRASTSSSTNLR